MSNIILKVAFPYRDERLYFSGWKSCSYEYLSINQIDLAQEVTAKFAIEEPHASEIILINDLAQTTKEITCIVQLEITQEITSLNYLADENTKEIIGINYLSEEKTAETYCINDIYENEVVTKELICLNSLRDAVSFERYSHAINVFLDDSLVTSEIKSWSIKISEDSYVNSISIVFVGPSLFSQCDPAVTIGTRRIKLIIDSIEFQFLLEKRTVQRDSSTGEFSVWGRSLVALLDLPYAIPIIDKDIVQNVTTGEWSCPNDSGYIPHIWQTGNRLASEIMDAVIKPPFTTVSFSLDFRLNDYIVKKGALSVNNSSPINVVNQLAGAIGGHVRTNLLDKVVTKYYKFDTLGTEVATYVDTENILQLDEQLDFPDGYNRILIKGWEDPLEESSVGLKIELDSELNEKDSVFYFGEEIWIRVYTSPFSLAYTFPTCSLGTIYEVTLNEIKTITEEKAVFVGGSMQLSYPINTITTIQKYDCTILTDSQYSFVEGYDYVTSEDLIAIEDEPVTITYTTKSDLYKLVVNQPCDPLPWDEVFSKIIINQI